MGGNYSGQVSGSDVFVAVEKGEITLKGAASLSAVNIVGTESAQTFEPQWTLSDTTAAYGTPKETFVTVNGVKSPDGVALHKKVVTLYKSALGKENVTVSNGYTLALGNDVEQSKSTAAWKVSGTNATLQSTTSEAYTLKNNKIVYTPQNVETLAELSGLAKGVKASSIALPAEKVLTLNAKVLGAKTTLKSNSGGYSINLTGNMKGKTFVGTNGADQFNITATNAFVNAGDGNDSLVGGNGNDTLSGDAGNDTLTGGKGNDVFVYTSGKDIISDYATGDKVSIGADISNSTINGTDAVFTIGKGTLTVIDGKGEEIVFVDATGKSRTIIGGAQVFTNSSSAKLTLSSGVEVGDASERTKTIKLTGNALDNTILGGSGKDSLYGEGGNDSLVGNAGNDKLYGQDGDDTLIGGAGNDSLRGGAGNDTLYGGAGNDTFIYKPGEDTDRIMDYTSGDMLTILKSNGKSGGTFTSSSFSGGDLTLSIKGGGTVVFDSVSKGNKFNINGKTYTISGTKLK